MIDNKIKLYKNLVIVEVTDFKEKQEVLYWEWTRDEFAEKYKTLKAMSFPIHWWRTIAMPRVQWFDNAKWDVITLQHMITSLSDVDKKTVQIKANNYLKDNNKYPTQSWINNLIERLVYPDKEKDDFNKLVLEWQQKRDKKIKRLNYFNWLSKESQKEIEKSAWKSVFKINANYDKHSIKVKILFTKYKNEILDDLIK